MPYKFKRYKIKWNFKRRKFKKVKKDRKKSREAYIRFRKHRATMLAALRKNRKKIKRKKARNENAGIKEKLAKARRKFKHLLKNSLEYNIDMLLFEEVEMEPEVELTEDDLKEIKDILDDIRGVLDDEDEDLAKYVDDAKDIIFSALETEGSTDKDAVSEILRFIDGFYKIQDEEESE